MGPLSLHLPSIPNILYNCVESNKPNEIKFFLITIVLNVCYILIPFTIPTLRDPWGGRYLGGHKYSLQSSVAVSGVIWPSDAPDGKVYLGVL